MNNNEFTLVFNKDNNFSVSDRKYGDYGDRIKIARSLEWFIRCALISVQDYPKDHPYRIHLEFLHADLIGQLKKQLTEDEWEEVNT